jgi:hypothetical protein
MGSLDDAIREHLELKRQHGASDDEVKRQEEEAFGRTRRPVPDQAHADQAQSGEAPAQEDLAEHQLEAAEPQSNGQPAEHAEPASTFEPDPFEPEPFEPDEVPAEESLQPEVTVRDVREHSSPDLEDSKEGQAPAASDPLEETPEFLEESEEDRLWFEQRPPKDFDLD